MDFMEIAQMRQSCRAYDKTRPVEKEKVEACLQAAYLAPSACNSQPYHFTVAMGEAAAQVAACTHGLGMNSFTDDAPVFVVVSEEKYNMTAGVGSKIKGQDYRAEDIGLTVAYLTAEAVTQGLSTCILGWFDQKKMQKAIGREQPLRLVIAMGYAKPDDLQRPKVRKAAETLTTWL